MQPLFPSIKTYAEHQLRVDDIHTIYIEECGNPDGIPVIVLHSGPGAGCEPYHRCFFDPQRYRIILFDQRGAGRSTPRAELRHNTTQDLIKDIETIREYLKVDKWVVFGGAWGSCLGLLYAQEHQGRVIGLVIHCVFLGRKSDINWFYQNGASQVFPDYWDEFVSGFSETEKQDLVKAYHARLAGDHDLLRMGAAKSWSLWQARTATLQPHSSIMDHFSDPHFAVSLATIESYYFSHHCFIEEDQIFKNLHKILHLPAYIIHGRYDLVCPLQCAWDLHRAWPKSELYIIRDAGHSIREPGIIDALVMATKKIAHPNHTAC